MNPNISEEIQNLYAVLNPSIFAYMLAAGITPAAFSPTITTPPNIDSSASLLDSDIPREEIECDIGTILAKNLSESLKKMTTSMEGCDGRKHAFRAIIEDAKNHSSPNVSLNQSSSSLIEGSFGSPMPFMEPKATSSLAIEEIESDSKKMRLNRNLPNLDDSKTSSHNGQLQIDFSEVTEAEADKIDVKTENTADKIADMSFKTEGMCQPSPQPRGNVPTIYVNESTKFRIERMTTIHKKKPKFNVEFLDLSYNSNMARNFPGAENRTEDQQARRNKNTLAARISRTKNKAYEKMLQDQSVDATTENIKLKRKLACLQSYAGLLMKINGMPDCDLTKMWQENVKIVVGISEKTD